MGVSSGSTWNEIGLKNKVKYDTIIYQLTVLQLYQEALEKDLGDTLWSSMT